VGKFRKLLFVIAVLFFIACKETSNADNLNLSKQTIVEETNPKTQTEKFSRKYNNNIVVGAERIDEYLPLIKNKGVAVLANHSSLVKNKHLVDTLLSLKQNVIKVFCPEHGFRGTADAGKHIGDYIDPSTNLPVISLYGNKKKPTLIDLKGVEVMIFDVQDVGIRFYTYISSLHYLMEACAENNIPIIVLDRPNPNGFYVDGPVLDLKYKSFVGMHPVPVVHGMTIAEYAQMINGELWLKNQIKANLKVVKMKNYHHNDLYKLRVNPSPNLKTMNAIYLYPSVCFFEGTSVSLGRGTENPFEKYGHPEMKNKKYSFQPKSMEGATEPMYENTLCYGVNLMTKGDSLSQAEKPFLDLSYIIDAYNNLEKKNLFFKKFFEKLAGNISLKKSIEDGESIETIRKSWEKEVEDFKVIRKKYLLYPDFE
jgi:uncharacterized protein YbbC (DUF1343 family)